MDDRGGASGEMFLHRRPEGQTLSWSAEAVADVSSKQTQAAELASCIG